MIEMKTMIRDVRCVTGWQCRDVACNVSTTTPPPPLPAAVIAGLTRNLPQTTGLRVVARNDGVERRGREYLRHATGRDNVFSTNIPSLTGRLEFTELHRENEKKITPPL
ncbi:MAG: hypothetical protein FWG84_06830 [Bacteroidales bacterium]|nr:hypothetical protein [Bacteroidales bacterium]